MTTTYYASVTSADETYTDVDHAGTSGTASDVFEFRMGNGTTVPTLRECIKALRRFERWIVQGGLNSAGANLPPSHG